MKKWLLVSLLVVHALLGCCDAKKVKILFPMPVRHVHHTKVVKVPEYHHYFHDRKRPHQKHFGHPEDDFEHYSEKEAAPYDADEATSFFNQASYNDFDYLPDPHNDFDDRRHTPPLPTKLPGGGKRQVQYVATAGAHNHNRQRNPYEPQHFYHKY